MASRRARGFALPLLGVVALLVGSTAPTVNAAIEDAAPVASQQVGSLPIVARHRYRMAAKIRPLLLFWIGREDVGRAQAVWRRGPDGAVGFELLVGSDPARAPRRINRWGYIAEQVRGSEARLLGVMKQSNEQSLEEAKSQVNPEETGIVTRLTALVLTDGTGGSGDRVHVARRAGVSLALARRVRSLMWAAPGALLLVHRGYYRGMQGAGRDTVSAVPMEVRA